MKVLHKARQGLPRGTTGQQAAGAAMQGLAYSVSGSWSSTPIDHPGLFVGGGETANIADFLRLLKAAFQVLCN